MAAQTNMISVLASDFPAVSATIFGSSVAEVVRECSVTLRAGRNVLEVSGLSSNIEPYSPRILGLTGDNVSVVDVSCRLVSEPTQGLDGGKHGEEIKQLNTQLRALGKELAAYKMGSKLVDGIGSRVSEVGVDDSLEGQVDFVDVIVKRKLRDTELISGIEEKMKKLKIIIDLHRRRSGVVNATLFASRGECQFNFQLTYLARGARWDTSYDLHAVTSDGKTLPDITLFSYAEITQDTGEEWIDTALTLSTVDSDAIPNPSSHKLNRIKLYGTIQQPPSVAVDNLQRLSPIPVVVPICCGPAFETDFLSPHTTSKSEQGTYPGSCGSSVHVSIPNAAIPVSSRSPISVVHRIGNPLTLHTDIIPHKVPITAALNLEGQLQLVGVPRVGASVFIEATIKNTTAYALLAGPVSVFMDGGFVTRTQLQFTGINQSFGCVLGVDTLLRTSYEIESQVQRAPQLTFVEPYNTTMRTVRIAITNGHPFDITGLVVRDVIPLGDESAGVKVTLRKPEGLACAKEGDEVSVGREGEDIRVRWTTEEGLGGEKDGMYEWVCGVQAGEEVQLETVWDVSAPENVVWDEVEDELEEEGRI